MANCASCRVGGTADFFLAHDDQGGHLDPGQQLRWVVVVEHLAHHRRCLGHQLRHEALTPHLPFDRAFRIRHERRPEHVAHDLFAHPSEHGVADPPQLSA